MQTASIKEVKKFWEKTPLFTGESAFTPGTKEFFEEHTATVINDCFAGKLDERIFPMECTQDYVPDLGCGPGFWLIELGKRGYKKIIGADLTESALALAKKRCELFGFQVRLQQENAEKLTFPDNYFAHVNCQGVIHHSPDTAACIREIARILKSGGSASISVYYTNIFLRLWPLLKWPAKILAILGAKLKGRGRDRIFHLDRVEDLVKMYDGADNPVGKAYSVEELKKLVEAYFIIEDVFFHFFPARALPFRLPNFLHQILDRYFGFLIYMNLRKI